MKIYRLYKSIIGFTIVEMIGVLAIIAILAGILIPKIFEAIRSSRINATIEAYNTIKTAALENFAKWGCFANTDGNPYVGTSFDAILLQEGRIDSRAADKIPLSKNGGTDNVYLEITQGPGGPPGPGYFLSGTQSGSLNTVSADYTVQIVIKNVSVRDARELSLRIDGPMLTATDEYSNDWQGRVAYTLFGTSQGDNRTLVWVYMYVAHR